MTLIDRDNFRKQSIKVYFNNSVDIEEGRNPTRFEHLENKLTESIESSNDVTVIGYADVSNITYIGELNSVTGINVVLNRKPLQTGSMITRPQQVGELVDNELKFNKIDATVVNIEVDLL